jgi:hypothetical protein
MNATSKMTTTELILMIIAIVIIIITVVVFKMLVAVGIFYSSQLLSKDLEAGRIHSCIIFAYNDMKGAWKLRQYVRQSRFLS